MRIFVRFSLVLLALSLAACAPDLAKLQTAEFQPYEPDLSGIAEPATIRGSYVENTDILGKTSRAVGVFALDGKTAFKGGFATPISLTPGTHSLTIGYSDSGYGDTIPVMLDAKPGGRYVVKRSKDTDWLDGLKYDRIRTWLYIEEEKTGEIAVPKVPDVIQSIEGRYQPPSGPDVGTMRGTVNAHGVSVYPIAVDGQIVKEDRERDLLVTARWEPTKPVALAPGMRAIAIQAKIGVTSRYLPILLDVKPNASYVANVDYRLKRSGETRIFTFTIWIEDGVTGEVVLPRTDLPGAPYPTL
ncbi:MAG: hypothetical protein CMI62_16290 [Parvibaculum sp.]|jgi:hypothetical protein|uniref:hypothetical protein n=1 Tax=Parvibaculum sp. TaxID=2024848 RepID=UPI000C412339|nr:hypothetical protein [Parvibaculum sp.]MAU62280.1 hypothetical protein [Parvibaculum sp.]HAC59377.1 hypothetical protein [Rhodobiaceae bacterium]|tara:strand:+ start:243 stop:1142 length:900 start_codon:yes stop_codon:yes gene_type:complete